MIIYTTWNRVRPATMAAMMLRLLPLIIGALFLCGCSKEVREANGRPLRQPAPAIERGTPVDIIDA